MMLPASHGVSNVDTDDDVDWSQAADFLAILYDESRGSYRTVATGCLRETRCGLIAIH